MRKTALVVALLLAGCSRKVAQPQAAAPAAPPAPPNLLQLTRGAVIADRTGEGSLDTSAVRLIDGVPTMSWSSPPDDSQQSVVLALPARSRIEQLGVIGNKDNLPHKVSFDLSSDGVRFQPAGTFAPQSSPALQLFRIAPTDASHVRMTVLDERRTVRVGEVFAVGTMQPGAPVSLAGCWTVNGASARFGQKGAAALGYVGGMYRMTFDGGSSDGRFYRFAWTRGAAYGLAAVSVGNGATRLNAAVWNEEAIDLVHFRAPDMLGERADCQTAEPAQDVFRLFIQRLHYFPLYGLRFDDRGALVEAESEATLNRVTGFLAANPALRVRFRSHELTRPTPQLNRAVAEQKALTLRAALERRGASLAHAEFLVLGADQPRRETTADTMRAMYSSVELEVVR